MRLQYICSSCKKSNFFKPKMESRAALQMKFGDEVRVNCNHCGKMEKKHLNKIRAVVDNRIVVGGFILGSGVIFLLGGYLGIMTDYTLSYWKALAVAGTTISGIPMYFWNRENKAVGGFNRYAIKRT